MRCFSSARPAIWLLVFISSVGIAMAKEKTTKNKPTVKAKAQTDKLLGSWYVMRETNSGERRLVKHITETNFTVVHYDSATHEPLVTIGGTWTQDGNTYREQVDFATETHKHLRGKEFTFKISVDRDTLHVEAVKGTGITSNTTWKRIRRDRDEGDEQSRVDDSLIRIGPAFAW